MTAHEKESLKQKVINIKVPKQIIRRHIQRTARKLFYVLCVVGCLIFCVLSISNNSEQSIRFINNDFESYGFQPLRNDLKFDDPSEHFDISFQFNMPDVKAVVKDWFDYPTIADDEARTGPGEQGQPASNTDESLKDLEKQLIHENQFNGLVSNIISVNRSVPNIKIEQCLTKQYLAKLPAVTIVIPRRNELYSVLQRSLHSIYNRTPKELLREIIIVDDYSTHGYSISEIMLYAERNFPNLVKFIKLPKRMGFVHARMAGAKAATGDVIVFLDSLIECNYNWLPPLLEPIAINDRIATAPVIDVIDLETFEYKSMEGSRTGLAWNFAHVNIDLRTDPNIDKSKPYKNAIMMDGLFAISRKFFWRLGGYDVDLDAWESESTELSFKIWMCGGMLLVAPCSRIGHLSTVQRSDNFEKSNKRVAEVWMNGFKHYFYSTNPNLFYNLDAGDLTKQHVRRKRLNCKPFKWYLEFVAPDFRTLEEHPFDLQPDYANGTIQSVAFPTYCLDTFGQEPIANVRLFPCAENHTMPHTNQMWNFDIRQEIKNFYRNICLDVFSSIPNSIVSMYSCTRKGGNQFWYYDKNEKLLVHNENGTLCLEAVSVDEELRVIVNPCKSKNDQMKWNFGFINKMLTPLRFFYNRTLEKQLYNVRNNINLNK